MRKGGSFSAAAGTTAGLDAAGCVTCGGRMITWLFPTCRFGNKTRAHRSVDAARKSNPPKHSPLAKSLQRSTPDWMYVQMAEQNQTAVPPVLRLRACGFLLAVQPECYCCHVRGHSQGSEKSQAARDWIERGLDHPLDEVGLQAAECGRCPATGTRRSYD